MARRDGSATAPEAVETDKRRRFVSPTSLGLQIVERHKEVRDPLTKSVTHYETADGRKVQRAELKILSFRPSSVLWPPGGHIYKHKLVGVHVSDDPAVNAVLEREADDPRGANIMEYPFELEQSVLNNKSAREDKGLFVEE